MDVRSIPRNVALALGVGAAAIAGIWVGAVTATRAPSPEPTVGVAALPTSTPDLRPTPPPRTLTPTQRPTPTPAPSPPAMTVIVTNAPNVAPSPILTPRPTPTSEPRGRAVVYFASRQGVPVAVDAASALGGQSESDKVFFRLSALRSTKTGGPPGYDNLYARMRARLAETTIDRPGTVVVGFSVTGGDWGVPADDVRLVLEQIVFTATEEPGIDLVLITQNGGKPAVIAGRTIDKELGRAELARP